MPRTCEVCGSSKLRKRHFPNNTVATCQSCGSSFDYYYRKDGRIFDYPTSWGKPIAVYYEPEGTTEADEDVKGTFAEGESYYVFLSEDGTIRRARISPYGQFDDSHTPRPKGVP